MKWRKKVKNQQLSIGERWKSDTEYYEKHGNMLSIPKIHGLAIGKMN